MQIIKNLKDPKPVLESKLVDIFFSMVFLNRPSTIKGFVATDGNTRETLKQREC